MTKTREYFNITAAQVPDDILLAYISAHKEKISTYLMTVDDGKNILSFLSGGALNMDGDTLSAELEIFNDVGSIALGSLISVLAFPIDSLRLDLLLNLYDGIGGLDGGLGALKNAVMVLTSKETRFLLGVYCQDRYNGMTHSEAWTDITIPEFLPLWDLINNLSTVQPDARQWQFEYAYLSYRQVGYGDSYDLRTDFGNGIVAFCYPSISGMNTVGILNPLTLYGSGSIGGAAPDSWEWDFDYDGNPDNFEIQAIGKQTSHTYWTTGSKTVGLRATTDGFAPVIITKSILVIPPPITVTAPNGFEDLYRHFETPKITGVQSYIWNFGDGVIRTDDDNTTSHPYAASGYFTVTLTQTLSDDTSIQSQAGIFVGPGTRYIQGHTINGDETWYSGGTYVVHGTITVAQGGRLTIEPGTIIKMGNRTYIYVYGTLKAEGTSDSKIVFTHITDDSYGGDTNGDGDATHPGVYQDASNNWQYNHWSYIYFGSTSTNSVIDNAIVKYAGMGWSYGPIQAPSVSIHSSSCLVKNSEIKYGYGDGIGTYNASPIISNNTISDMASYGLYIRTNSSPTVIDNTISNNLYGMNISADSSGLYQGNTFSGNTSYGIYYSGTSVIDATNCDWGDPSGPLDTSDDRATDGWYNPNGLGDKVSDHVNYTPWVVSIVSVPGDIDHDGVVDLADVVVALQVIAGIDPGQPVFTDADVNQDGKIGIEEVVYILQNVSGQR